MLVLRWVLHDSANVFASVVEDKVVPSGVVGKETRHVVDPSVARNPAARGRGMLSEILRSEDSDALGHGWTERRTRGTEAFGSRLSHHFRGQISDLEEESSHA